MPRRSWFKAERNDSENSASISIFSEIGGFGVSAQAFSDELKGLGKPDTINLAISSDGGDVTVGFAIFDMLAQHPAYKVVRVQGLAASMASVIAMVGDEVVMPSNAQLMIHNPWGSVWGESDQIISFGEALAQMRDNIVDAYRGKSNLSKAKLIAMMDRETWLTAKQAVELGFADRVEKAAAFASLRVDLSKFNNVPAAFGRKVKEITTMAKVAKKSADPFALGEEGETVAKTEKEIRADMLAQHKEIRAACELAGKPELADEFIDDDLSLSDAVAKLKEARDADADKGKGKGKSKDGGTELNARHAARTEGEGGQSAEIDYSKIWAKWKGSKAA